MGGSAYSHLPGAVGDDRVYGVFPDQVILGYRCSIKTTSLSDHSFAAVDKLGFPGMFVRKGAAIHISGLDPFGRKTGPGFIRALARYSVVFERKDHPTGLGTDCPGAACIVTWDGDAAGRFHRTDDWQHHGNRFGAETICEWLDSKKEGYVRYCDKQHVSAVRRLLDSSVDVSNNYLAERAILRRKGRWAYEWEMG